MTEQNPQPNLANAQVTGGGGHEPDAEQQPTERPEPASSGSGVDLKSEHLGDRDD